MVQSGIDNLLQLQPSWKRARIGLVTNHAALTSNGEPVRKALLDQDFHLTVLFSPEHGLDVQGADGEAMLDGKDTLTGLPIVSLYGDKLAPDANDLLAIDVLLFDIPDVGARFYTYLWTLTHCMEVCAKAHKTLVVLDRPNPISGNLQLVEGPMLDETHCSSFIGRWSMPVRHSCTMGELARYFNAQKQLHLVLDVIGCTQWHRAIHQPATGWAFTPTSPAIQDYQAMLFYPGTCLLEATNLHEGRATNSSFHAIAAPWLDTVWLKAMIARTYPQVICSDIQFKSSTNKYQSEHCVGLSFEVNDTHHFLPVQFGLWLIKSIKDHHPEFAWANYPTAVNPSGSGHLDRLVGIPNATELFELPFNDFMQQIKRQCTVAQEWSSRVKPWLLY